MTAEIDALAGTPETLTLPVSGVTVQVQDLKTRQLFKLLRIITRGGAGLLQDFNLLDPNLEQGAFVGRFVALVVMAVPEAEDETLEFLQSMVEPTGLVPGRRLSPGDKEANEQVLIEFTNALVNPELEDTLALIERIVQREADDIQSLGKRLGSIFQIARKTGQLPDQSTSQSFPTSTPTDSSEGSPEPSTSSSASTAGRTSSSETVVSVV